MTSCQSAGPPPFFHAKTVFGIKTLVSPINTGFATPTMLMQAAYAPVADGPAINMVIQ